MNGSKIPFYAHFSNRRNGTPPELLFTMDDVQGFSNSLWARHCAEIRELRGTEEYKEQKRQLPVIEPNNGTGLMFFDFDGIDVEDHIETVTSLPFVLWAGESPSGSLHVICPGDYSPHTYDECLRLWRYIGYDPDPQCNDRVRLKFLFDSKFNTLKSSATPITLFLPSGGSDYIEHAIIAIETAPDGQKHKIRNKMAYTVGGMVPDGDPDNVVERLVDAALRNTTNPRGAEYDIRTAFKQGQANPLEKRAQAAPLSSVEVSYHPDVLLQANYVDMAKIDPRELEEEDLLKFEVGGESYRFITGGQLIAVGGQAKTRKSFLMRSIMQALSGVQYFGELSFTASLSLPVWYFDTEQTRKDLALSFMEMPTGPNVRWYNLLRLSQSEALAVVTHALETFPKGLLIIDNLLDVANFNDLDKAETIAKALNRYGERTGGAVIAVVHMNYSGKGGSTKFQGHTGSLLYRKAQMVLELTKKEPEWTAPTIVEVAMARRVKPFKLYMTIEDGKPVYSDKAPSENLAPANNWAPSPTLEEVCMDIAGRPGQAMRSASIREFYNEVAAYYKKLGLKPEPQSKVRAYRDECPYLETDGLNYWWAGVPTQTDLF
jgi:hypothetical protein